MVRHCRNLEGEAFRGPKSDHGYDNGFTRDNGETHHLTYRMMARTMPRKSPSSSENGPGQSLEFRKTNEAIGLRLREGRLTLLSRKLFNVMVYKAQNSTLGADAPIESEANRKYFWVPLSDMARDAAYDSHDTDLLKQHLTEMQNIKVVKEDANEWISERLVASVKLVNPEGLKKRGGMVWLGFTFPPEVHELVMNPSTYTKLSIYYQSLMRSGASLALYEICRRYATNPSHKTGIHECAYWHAVLTGNPISEEPPPYKYIKRDLLKPAIAEINATTDIEVELIEHKRGRKVVSLQFEVHMTRQPGLDLPAPPVINSALQGQLQALGFSLSDAQDLCAMYSEEKLLSTLTIVHERMHAKGSPPLDAPAAYFRWAIKNAQHISTVARLAPAQASKPKPTAGNQPSPLERFLTARARDAMSAYKELSQVDADAAMQRFLSSAEGKNVKPGRGIESRMTNALFGRWYAKELWGEPTAEALDRFLAMGSDVVDEA